MSTGRKIAARIKCLGKCGKEKASGSFYINSNPLFASEKLEICKDCINDFIGRKDTFGYADRSRLVLAIMDKPFIADLWESRDNDWSRYIPQISSLAQYKLYRFSDSDFGYDNNRSRASSLEEIDMSDEETKTNFEELSSYWGRGYSFEDYRYLEEERTKFMASFECSDYGMEMLMRDICFINLSIEKIRESQNNSVGKEITELIKTRSTLMNDANIKPIQSTGSEANDQITFGALIKKWENEKPVPQALNDEMKNYIDTYMIGHLAKMEGLSNELTERYERSLSDYTIDFKDIRKDDSVGDD